MADDVMEDGATETQAASIASASSFPAVQIVPSWTRWFASSGDPATRVRAYQRVLRVLVVLALGTATYYITWRYFDSINWTYWWVALALLAAETSSYLGAWLFGLSLWRIKLRPAPPPPIPNSTVDVFVVCYHEPVESVRATAEAARDIIWPHRTYILDEGHSAALEALAAEVGVEYLTRSSVWQRDEGLPTADALVNAAEQTEGEFILVLDADQVPSPEILTHTLGYFRDPAVAFVQTPQWFYNTPAGDPFGTDAALFYGPIQQSKDGWDAAYFCGSNALLRRAALVHIATRYAARDQMRQIHRAMRVANQLLRRAADELRDPDQAPLRDGIDRLRAAVKASKERLQAGATLQDVNWEFQREAENIRRLLVHADLAAIQRELGRVPGLKDVGVETDLAAALTNEAMIETLADRALSPLAAVTVVRALLLGVDLERSTATESVTPIVALATAEDMEIAIRMHASGWKSVYHHEILARGLAPEDFSTALQQRLRWAQGTIQTLLRERPLLQPGLAVGQRLSYFATLWSYLAGFASLIYLVTPVLYLFFGWLPVRAYSADFFWHLLPFLIANQLLFLLVGWGLPTWRGQQYRLALFPVWIKVVTRAVANVYFGRPLGFGAAPQARQAGVYFDLVRPQLILMGVIALAVLWGLGRLLLGFTDVVVPVLVNVFWSIYNLLLLSVVIRAATYTPPLDSEAGTPTATKLSAATARGRITEDVVR